MNKIFPILLLSGLTCIVIVGLWVVEKYDTYSVYPEEVYIYLMVGIGLIIIAFVMEQFKGKRITETKKDNRAFINKVWKNKVKVGDRAFLIILIIFAIIAILNLDLALSLITPILCLVLIIIGFIFIMHDDGVDDEGDQPKSRFMQILLWLIDYRNHPFSIPLVLFILIVVTTLLSKQLGFILDLGGGGGFSRYTTTLSIQMKIYPALIYTCGLLYIIQHVDFLGIRQAKQSIYKLIFIHVAEIIHCGSTVLILLVELIAAF